MCRFSFYLFFFSFIPYYWTSLKLSRFHTSIRWTEKNHFFACKMKVDANQFLYWNSTAVSSSPNDCCSMFESIVWWIDTSRVGNNVATITNTADLVEFDMRVIHQNNKSHVLWFQPFHHRKWQWLCLCISFCSRALSLIQLNFTSNTIPSAHTFAYAYGFTYIFHRSIVVLKTTKSMLTMALNGKCFLFSFGWSNRRHAVHQTKAVCSLYRARYKFNKKLRD